MRLQYQKELHPLLLLWNKIRAEKWVFIGQKFLGGSGRQISIFVDWIHELCRRQLPPAAPKHYEGDESEPKSRKFTNNEMKDAVKRLRTISEPQSQLVIVCAFVMSENFFITYSHLIHFLFFLKLLITAKCIKTHVQRHPTLKPSKYMKGIGPILPVYKDKTSLSFN